MMKSTKRILLCLCLWFTGSATADSRLSLEGKLIGISVIGTSHHWDYMAYKGQIDTIARLGGSVIPFDAYHDSWVQGVHIQTLIEQQPDAIIQQLGSSRTLDPWLARVREADIPLFTVDTVTKHAINVTTSDNYRLSSAVALHIVTDMHGEGKILVFNGFYDVPVCRTRYDQLQYVIKDFPRIEFIEPELVDVIPDTVRKAYADMTEALARYGPDSGLKAVWACFDQPMIGATQAIIDSGRTDIKTYGIDGSKDYVDMVKDPDNPVAAMVVIQNPYQIGAEAVLNVARYLSGESVPPVTIVPEVIVESPQ